VSGAEAKLGGFEDAVFRLDGARAMPTRYAAGPWSPSLQHGSAPAAIIARTAERIPTPSPMRVVRMTIDLMRPVPTAPLTIRWSMEREGRAIQIASISLFTDDGKEVVRASVLKIRIDATEVPPASELCLDLPPPDSCPQSEPADLDNPFLSGVDVGIAKGAFRSPGPAAAWFRARRPIIATEAPTPLMRASIAADFSNGTAAVLDLRKWTFVNADLTVTLSRDPVGEWILLDAETWLAANGAGIAAARLADLNGYFGRAVQCLVVRPVASA